MTTFSELSLSPYLQERLASARFTTPTPVQAAAIPQALAGKDVLATAQTGTGKTLAFLVPVLERLLQQKGAGLTALVLVPTRELAMQVLEQYEALRGRQLGPAVLIVGGLPEAKQLATLRKGARLAVATPGRLEDFLGRGLVNLRGISVLVLDEADRMLDMGFQPSIRRITGVLPKDRQTMCFSATMESSVERLVNDLMRQPVRLALGSALKPAQNVQVRAYEVLANRKEALLCDLLEQQEGPCLVFTRTKRGTERLAKSLEREGFSANRIHGDRSQSQRSAALAGFQRGDYQVLVATDIASRGIHVEGIAQVINYDLPEDAETFIHRAGRTGRAGERGIASTLVAREEWPDLLSLERKLGISIDKVREDRKATAAAIPRVPGQGERKGRTGQRRESVRAPRVSASRLNLSPMPGEVLQAHGA